MRLNLTLDDQHAEVLQRLAERTHVQPGTLARSMLQTLLDRTVEQEERASTPSDVVALLDGIDGAFELVGRRRAEAAAGDVVSLSEL